MDGLRLWHGAGTAHVGRPTGPAFSIISDQSFPVHQGSLRDFASLRVLTRPRPPLDPPRLPGLELEKAIRPYVRLSV
jgi:hypothetical protein